MKKIKILFLFITLLFISACNSEKIDEQLNTVTINVYDKESNLIYDEKVETKEKILSDVITNIEDLKVITVDSEYGEYITSILDIEEGDNYYWSYYIDDEYAQTGISSCKVEDGKTYSFKIERYVSD